MPLLYKRMPTTRLHNVLRPDCIGHKTHNVCYCLVQFLFYYLGGFDIKHTTHIYLFVYLTSIVLFKGGTKLAINAKRVNWCDQGACTGAQGRMISIRQRRRRRRRVSIDWIKRRRTSVSDSGKSIRQVQVVIIGCT